MKTYIIQIGSMNGQHNYRVKASSSKHAKEIAIKRHNELGRVIKSIDRVYVILSY